MALRPSVLLALWQAIVDPHFCRRPSNTQNLLWGSLLLSPVSWCTPGFACALQASLEGMRFDFNMIAPILEKAMATHSSSLAWKIPWMEDPGRLQSMGLQRVGHNWVTLLSLFTFMHWRRKWQPIQCSCLENPRDGGAWWAAVYGVAQSWTRLKRLSSSNSSPSNVTLQLFLCPWMWGIFFFALGHC